MRFPKLKKKLASFLKEEDGRISRESVMKIGSFLSILGISIYESKLVSAGHSSEHTNTGWDFESDYEHTNMLSLQLNESSSDGGIVRATHAHDSGAEVDHSNRYNDSG